MHAIRPVRQALTIICLSAFIITSCLDRYSIAKTRLHDLSSLKAVVLELDNGASTYRWNVNERELPLLGLSREHLQNGFDQTLTYSGEQFDFPIFKSLSFDEEQGKYLLPIISKSSKTLSFIEFAPTTKPSIYASDEGIQLIDKGDLKTVSTSDGRKYLFIKYPDDEFRCAAIKQSTGETVNLLYTANGLALHGLVDSAGRSITFNYDKSGIRSLTQTWMANSEGLTKTWSIGDEDRDEPSTKYAHVVGLTSAKFLPANAVVREYTPEMAASDKLLAQIFGGPNAVAGANGFEPAGLAAAYPLYRGDIIGDDGKIRLGHLSHAMHIYGSADGRGDSPLYVPAGFTSHSNEPSPTDAAVVFYYPKLENLTDVTLAIFHVADFKIEPEGDRVRIGNLGGPGGSSPLYKHSHIEFYKGNVGLPAAAARAGLRIDPATVFAAAR